MEEEFLKLKTENSRLRKELAILLKDLKPKEQIKVFIIVNKIINVEVGQEKFCNL